MVGSIEGRRSTGKYRIQIQEKNILEEEEDWKILCLA